MTEALQVRGRRGPGPRERRSRQRRRRRRVLRGVAAVVAVVALGGGGWAIGQLDWSGAPRGAATTTTAATGAPADQATLALTVHGNDGGARSLSLLAAGPEPSSAALVFLPTGLLVDLPGVGVDRVGLAHQYGGGALVEAAIENTLGIDVDHTASVSDSGLAAMLDRAGGLPVEIPERLIRRAEDGSAAVRFEPGAQHLDGPRLVEYWSFRERSHDELGALPRQQLVWQALLAAIAGDPTVAEAAVGEGAELDTTAPAAWVIALLKHTAHAQAQDTLVTTLLPVEPFGDGGGGEGEDAVSTYRLRDDAAGAMVADLFGPSVPRGDAADRLRLQVLNGVGVPGIGQVVERRLQGTGVQVVRTDNARSFDFTQTRILIYEETPELLAAAERVRAALGVGTIEVSRQAQSVVDLTVVVGADLVATPPPQESNP